MIVNPLLQPSQSLVEITMHFSSSMTRPSRVPKKSTVTVSKAMKRTYVDDSDVSVQVIGAATNLYCEFKFHDFIGF